ncbi:MAG: tetratricopeptide repeat protein, partial [Calditrichia bacterium]
SPITFASMYTNPTTDKYWTWLKITGNGIGGEPPENVLHNVNIESADYGLYLYNTNADIQYSTFQYNRYSNVILGNSDAYFYSNTIKNTISGHGISLNNSSPDFYGNLISDNQGTGIDCYNYSSPKFGSTTSSDEGKNIVRNNNPGILASYYSNPFLGDWDGEENRIGGYNSIYDNGEYAVQAEDNSGVTAQFNWWGDYPVSKEIFYSDETSKIVYANALNFDPNEMIMAKITNGNSYHRGSISNNPNDPRLLLRLARCYRYQKRPVLALGVYKQLINNYPNHREARWGLIEILEAFTEAGQDSSVNFLQRIRNIHPNGKMKRVASDLLSAVFIEKGKTSAAIANCQQIVSNYPDTESEKTALFDLFCIYLNTLRDSSQAQGALSVMEQKYPGDQLTIFAQYQMGRPGGTSAQLTKVSPTAEKQTPNFPQANPNIFQLSQNYPNPFNPQTQIRFALPQQANVKLTIYDVSGRQVRTLVNENMPAGYHTAVWNGRNDNGAQVGTGVYFYHITAGDPSTGSGQRFSQVRMMLLVR